MSDDDWDLELTDDERALWEAPVEDWLMVLLRRRTINAFFTESIATVEKAAERFQDADVRAAALFDQYEVELHAIMKTLGFDLSDPAQAETLLKLQAFFVNLRTGSVGMHNVCALLLYWGMNKEKQA